MKICKWYLEKKKYCKFCKNTSYKFLETLVLLASGFLSYFSIGTCLAVPLNTTTQLLPDSTPLGKTNAKLSLMSQGHDQNFWKVLDLDQCLEGQGKKDIQYHNVEVGKVLPNMEGGIEKLQTST